MVATYKLFAGSIPEIYDRFMVPLIFEVYARDLADRLAKAAPQDLLETAAGTGVLTRAVAARLPVSTRITATDLNQPMLDAPQPVAQPARVWRIGFLSNPWLLGGLAAQAVAQLAITYLPVMNELFRTAPIPPEAWVRILGVALLTSLVVAIDKRLRHSTI